MEVSNQILGKNIETLRKEARLSTEEFASKAGIPVETVKAWEQGLKRPYTKELMVICPILRIHEEDLLERDIYQERCDAMNRLKQSKTKTNYNWYFGDPKKRAFYLSALIIIPAVFLLVLLILKASGIVELNIEKYLSEGLPVPSYIKFIPYIGAYFASSFVGSIYIIIELFKKLNLRIQVLYIILFFGLISVCFFIGLILLIPFYIYALLNVFKKGYRGK